MVIDDFHLERVSIRPLKADAPLLVDADAVLTLAVTLESFELIRRRDHEIAQIYRTVEIFELLARPLLDPTVESFHELSAKDRLGVLALERPDHG